MSDCTRCDRATRDGRTVCDTCTDAFRKQLAEMPWTVQQLTVSQTRQRGVLLDPTGSASAVSLLPYQPRAAEVLRDLHSALASTVMFLHEEGIRPTITRGDPDLLPRDTAASMAAWLLASIERLVFHELAGRVIDEIEAATDKARTVIFFKPSQRVYLGPCLGLLDEDGAEAGPCPGEVYADEGADLGQCDECKRPHPVDERRAWLNEQMGDRLMTAAEIATAAVTLFGMDAKRDRVRNLVTAWDKRKRIRSHEGPGNPRYRYGEVLPLLQETYSGKA